MTSILRLGSTRASKAKGTFEDVSAKRDFAMGAQRARAKAEEKARVVEKRARAKTEAAEIGQNIMQLF